MAKVKKNKVKPTQTYNVVVLECAHCGEEMHMVKSCDFCNAEGSMKVKEEFRVTKEELQALYDKRNGEIAGDAIAILRDEDEATSKLSDADTSPFSEKDMGEITLDEL